MGNWKSHRSAFFLQAGDCIGGEWVFGKGEVENGGAVREGGVSLFPTKKMKF